MEDKKDELEDCILVLSDVLDVMYTKDYVSFILGWYFKDRDKLGGGAMGRRYR